MRINTKLTFGIAFFSTLLGPVFLPKLHLFYFVPYLVISFYQLPRHAVLWRAYFSGIIIDLLSSSPLFGLTSLNYSIVCWVLYGQTRNFFEDKPSTLPLMTFLFSFLSTLFSAITLLFFKDPITFSGTWIVTDLIGMSLADAFYALLVFSLPFQLTYSLRKLHIFKRS